MTNLKSEVFTHCKAKIVQQLTGVEDTLAGLKEALHSESKSTAGDKHETGRAMIQLQMEQTGTKVVAYRDQLLMLDRIEKSSLSTADKVAVGSLVYTDKAIFFIAVSLGILTVSSQKIAVVSAVTPAAQALLGKSVGDVVQVNTTSYSIKAIL